LNIEQEKIVMGAFGHATSNKRILQILEALALLKKRKGGNFHFYIVGKVTDLPIENKLKEFGLTDNVTVTGFTTLEDFKTYMGSCDICFNLRYPTQGESSASLHRMLGLGKIVIVTNIGSFEGYPDDIVYKVRYDDNEVLDIYNILSDLFSNHDKVNQYGSRGVAFAKECYNVTKNAQKYIEFVSSIINDNFAEYVYIDTLIDKLYEFQLTNDNYIQHLCKTFAAINN
jgi:glycosyltransferase involved in cell wall biosynthesis